MIYSLSKHRWESRNLADLFGWEVISAIVSETDLESASPDQVIPIVRVEIVREHEGRTVFLPADLVTIPIVQRIL